MVDAALLIEGRYRLGTQHLAARRRNRGEGHEWIHGAACLYCRSRITAEGVGFESIRATDPERAEALEKEGYIPELGEPAPAVIPFTTTVASSAMQEFVHRLTGYMGQTGTAPKSFICLTARRSDATASRPGQNAFAATALFGVGAIPGR